MPLKWRLQRHAVRLRGHQRPASARTHAGHARHERSESRPSPMLFWGRDGTRFARDAVAPGSQGEGARGAGPRRSLNMILIDIAHRTLVLSYFRTFVLSYFSSALSHFRTLALKFAPMA